MSEDAREPVGNAGPGLAYEEALVFELSRPGRGGASIPAAGVPEIDPAGRIPREWLRDEIPGLPELSEVEVVRHFTRLSTWNAAVDLGLYPLGSCTMKYNPKVNDKIAALPGFAQIHPSQPASTTQGAMQLLWELEQMLCEIAGMDAFTLQPAAGAHGEMTGMLIIRAHHVAQGKLRRKVIVPDSSHGTNPASAHLCGCGRGS